MATNVTKLNRPLGNSITYAIAGYSYSNWWKRIVRNCRLQLLELVEAYCPSPICESIRSAIN